MERNEQKTKQKNSKKMVPITQIINSNKQHEKKIRNFKEITNVINTLIR